MGAESRRFRDDENLPPSERSENSAVVESIGRESRDRFLVGTTPRLLFSCGIFPQYREIWCARGVLATYSREQSSSRVLRLAGLHRDWTVAGCQRDRGTTLFVELRLQLCPEVKGQRGVNSRYPHRPLVPFCFRRTRRASPRRRSATAFCFVSGGSLVPILRRRSFRFLPINARLLFTIALGLALAVPAFAQAGNSPWENAVNVLQTAFTSTIARGLSLVAIVVSGLTFAFGEGGSKRVLAGVLFGVGMAIAAVNFLAWLFPGS